MSATSVCEVTGIPRATCIRKLEKLTSMRLIAKDKVSKRYAFNLNQKSSYGLELKEIIDQMIEIFSQLYLTIIKTVIKN